MAITIAAVRDLCQVCLRDPSGAVWSDADVEAWVIEAIRAYSVRFSRTLVASVAGKTGDYSFDLPKTTVDVVSVQYPTPTGNYDNFFVKGNHLSPEFYAPNARLWDWSPSHDRDTTAPQLWVPNTVTGQNIRIYYKAMYYDYATTPTNVEVPDNHIPILEQYVYWKAMAARLAELAAAAAPTPELFQTLHEIVVAHRLEYEQMISSAAGARVSDV